MKKFLRTGLIIVACLGAIQLAGMWYFGKLHAELTERYTLSEAGLEYAVACENRMNWHDKEFSSGRDTLDGCGCMAGKVGTQFPDDMVAGAGVIEDAIDWIANESEQEPDWSALAQEASIDATLYEGLLDASFDALGACNSE